MLDLSRAPNRCRLGPDPRPGPHRGAAAAVVMAVGLGLLGLPAGPALWRGEITAARAANDRVDSLRRSLRSERDPSQRRQAAAELGELGDSDAVPWLVRSLLDDRSDEVRAACAEALGQIGDAAARFALRAATRDESRRVQRQASAALEKLTEKPSQPQRTGRRVTVVVGKTGSKAKSGTLGDVPKRLREAVIKELRATPEFDVVEELADKAGKNTFSVDSSVTGLSRRTTPSGELEISCDVSVVIALMPGRNIVGMVTGGASAFGPRGPSSKPTKALLENLETQALTQAVQAANENLVSFLRAQNRQ